MQILKIILRYIYEYIPFKKHFFLVLRKFYKPSPPMVRRLRFKGIIKLHCDNNSFKLRHYGYPIENDLFWNGIGKGWEKISLQIWSELIHQGKAILDIGANTGIYSLIAKTLNPHAKIWAFEPVKRVYGKLQYNCNLNGYDIQCENYALSNYNGSAIIYDTGEEHIYSVTVNKNLLPPGQIFQQVEIPVQTLKAFIETNKIKKTDIIKLDVETHEYEVLQGMGEYLFEMKPSMIIEVLEDNVADNIGRLLQGLDYLYFDIDEENGPLQMKNFHKGKSRNVLVCPKEIASNLGLSYVNYNIN